MTFYKRSKTCGWNITLDEFEDAIHDLQAWGELTPASRQALKCLAEKAASV